MTRVVVSGYGAVTPLGLSADATWRALLNGENGVTQLKEAWAHDFPVRMAARVDNAFADSVTIREARRLDRSEQLALIAGRQAWESAGKPDVDPTRLAVVIGTAVGGISTTIDQSNVLNAKGPRGISPHAITKLMPNGPAAWLSIDLGGKGGARAPVSACASGSEAIAMGREMLLAGSVDAVVCGGVEASVIPSVLATFNASRALSTNNGDFSRASRPFDKERDGFVLGEGSAVVVLEREEDAQARGARVHGVIAGAAVTSDAIDIVKSDPRNQARTMTMAMRVAGLTPEDVGLVHAHATSTRVGDLNEALAISAALSVTPPVTATKGATGHLLGAAGALSTLFALLSLRDGVIPPTINLQEQDPAVDLDVVREPRPTTAAHALVNAFGFGGHSATLAVSRA